MEKTWLKQYPAGVPAEIDVAQYRVAGRADATRASRKYARPAGLQVHGQVDRLRPDRRRCRARFAAWLQSLGLEKGDRVAIMMPNVPQYPVAVAGDPARRLRGRQRQPAVHAARARAPAEGFGREGDRHRRELRPTCCSRCSPAVPTKKVILAAIGDMLGFPKGARRQLRGAQRQEAGAGLRPARRRALQRRASRRAAARPSRRPQVGPDDIAVLQYTGGTTGVSKGAVLLHRNLVANILQSEAWYQPALKKIPAGEQIVTICALPLYHIFGFNTNMMLGDAHGRLQHPDPESARPRRRCSRSCAARRSTASRRSTRCSTRMAHHADFGSVDWSHLKISVGGGMAVQRRPPSCGSRRPAARSVEGYGLSETSPSATCNPVDSTAFSGNIGLPMPNTELTLLDDDGHEVPLGTPGEIAIRGPAGDGRLLAAARRDGQGDDGRRLLPQRRHRRRRRARLLQDRRPQEGHDPGQRLQRLSERGRGRRHADARRARVRGGRRARREVGRGGQAGDRAQEGPGRHRGRRARLLRGQPHRLQAAEGRSSSAPTCRRRRSARSCAASCAARLGALGRGLRR